MGYQSKLWVFDAQVLVELFLCPAVRTSWVVKKVDCIFCGKLNGWLLLLRQEEEKDPQENKNETKVSLEWIGNNLLQPGRQ